MENSKIFYIYLKKSNELNEKMTKKNVIILIIFLLIIFFNKKIISYYYLYKFSNWVERPVEIDHLKFSYFGNIEIQNIKILNSQTNYYKNIFTADKIKFKTDVKSIFSDLIIIDSLSLINPKFYLDIKITKKKEGSTNVYDDNIGLAKKINEDIPDKIWPTKNKDINFMIKESNLSGAKAYIKISNIESPVETKLSTMKFSSFGNEKNYRHYKDVLKSILYDLYARTIDGKVKKTLKEIYNF